MRVLLIGPTGRSSTSIEADVAGDLRRLRRPGIEVDYRCTGAGPVAIRSAADAAQAAPYVVSCAARAVGDGYEALIIDCTDDPGLEACRAEVTVPVVGAGEALRAAIDTAPTPVAILTGDDLRRLDVAGIIDFARGSATIALGATGFSHVAAALAASRPDLTVLDPLDLALAVAVAAVRG